MLFTWIASRLRLLRSEKMSGSPFRKNLTSDPLRGFQPKYGRVFSKCAH